MEATKETFNFINSSDLPEQEEFLSKILNLGLNFKCRETPAFPLDFPDVMETFFETCPEQSTPLPNLFNWIDENIVKPSTNFASPYSMAFPDAGNSLAGTTGDILATLLNQNLIRWMPCSPVATVIDMVVLQWLRELIGYPVSAHLDHPADVAGLVTSGGVASNTIALLIARETHFPQTMRDGLRNCPLKPIVIIPNGIDHYSSRLATGWLGLGESSVIRVPTVNFKYDLVKLEETLQNLKNSNDMKPFFLVCYAGDSYSQTCDDFLKIREICNNHGAWMHVDACHGTQLVFSPKLKRQFLSGIELADSITVDPHKVFCVPYTVSMVLFKNKEVLESIRRPEDIITGEMHSFGQLTPLLGSRSFASLKLYLLIKNLGRIGLQNMIEKRCKMALFLKEKIKEYPDLVLVNPEPNINSVMFLYCPRIFLEELKNNDNDGEHLPKLIKKLNEVNSMIQEALISGGIWLHIFEIPDLSKCLKLKKVFKLRPLRFMSGNPLITEAHIVEMLEKVKAEGELQWQLD